MLAGQRRISIVEGTQQAVSLSAVRTVIVHISCAPLQATFPVLKKKSTKPICASRDALAYTMVQQLGGTICPRLLLQFIVLDWQSGLGDSTCLRILSCSQIVGPAFSKESWQAVELHLMYLLKGFI